jgi:hypothetical protein
MSKEERDRIREIRARYAVLGDPALRSYRHHSAAYLYAKMRASGWVWVRRTLVWIKPLSVNYGGSHAEQ